MNFKILNNKQSNNKKLQINLIKNIYNRLNNIKSQWTKTQNNINWNKNIQNIN